MTKPESLIYLINSLTKAEKKSISSAMINSTSNFEKLYYIVVKNKNTTADIVRTDYNNLCKGTYPIHYKDNNSLVQIVNFVLKPFA